jgi:protocatechuate 3,4-dioxygenase beta subunit
VAEGPFYYETSLERRALAEGRAGEPLTLRIRLGGILPEGPCQSIHGAIVDVWHTDAAGLYSNVGPDLQPVDTTGQTFLRGHQTTDHAGYVEFETIVPGWEIVAAAPPVFVARRTTHIHVKAYHGRSVLTTQLFFPDELLDDLYATREPYKSHATLSAPGLGRPYARIRNGEDIFFQAAKTRPMEVKRVNGRLTAEATIGVVGFDNRTFKPLFR